MSIGRVEAVIREKLHGALHATHLEIVNESPPGAETHFRIVIVSRKFQDLPSLERHQLVNGVLRDEMRAGVQALFIVAKTPEQWDASVGAAPARPALARRRANSTEYTRWP